MKTCPGQGNYPDDIRQYDDDPRSPFYDPPNTQCKICGLWTKEEDIDDNEVCSSSLCHAEAYPENLEKENG